MMKPTVTSIIKNYLMAGLVVLGAGLCIISIVEFSRFYQANKRYSQLASLRNALHQYHEEKGRFPVISQTGTGDDSTGSWRVQVLPNILRQIQPSDDIREVTLAIEQTPLVAVLNSNGCVWDEDATGTFRALRHRFGNPIVVVYAPNIVVDWEESNELLIAESKISFQRSGTKVAIHDLERGLALRLDGTVETIPSFSEEDQLYKYLSSKDSF